jgi:hypothetical protein
MIRPHRLGAYGAFGARAVLAGVLVPAQPAGGLDPFVVREARIDANRVATSLSNVGAFGTSLVPERDGIEFPRGSGFFDYMPTGIWVGANLNGARQGAIFEYVGEFRPGPMIGGTYAPFDTTMKVYKVAHGDTTGWADWMAHAVPLGAPTGDDGTAPGVLGSQMLWTVYNDADPTQHRAAAGTLPLGLEIRQSAWAFKEHGPRDNVVLLRWRIENRGSDTLDSVYVGVWADPDIGGAHTSHFGSDAALGMNFSYPDTVTGFQYGDSVPAVALRLLEGARATPGGPDLGATAITPYFHGIEPSTPFEYGNLLRGLETNGATLVDPTTGLPTTYRYSGDARAGTGWLDTLYADMRMLVSSGPFTMAPGDTQQITAALVFGWGPRSEASLDSLYENAQADFFAPLGEEYVDPEPPPPPPVPGLALDAWPNPAHRIVRFSFVPNAEARYALDVYDVRGRHVANLARGVGAGQTITFQWVAPLTVVPAFGE